tara:strand:+ start:7787 stop:8434 length:648 start_codon:yes stop_codon:yes gene_type:complete
MQRYAKSGLDDFVVALGYRGDELKAAFARGTDAWTDPSDTPAASRAWHIDAVDTGLDTNTGGRIRQLVPHMGGETFMLTWCDGLADIDLDALLRFHRSHGKLATVTAVHPPARFGHLTLDGERVTGFYEKHQPLEGWINGAFFVLEPGVADYIADDHSQWEQEPLQALAADNQLMAYKHSGFWRCVDYPQDRHDMEKLWAGGAAPWRLPSPGQAA